MLKDTPNGQTNYYVSKCCHAQVSDRDLGWMKAESALYFHTCNKCGDICDIISASELK